MHPSSPADAPIYLLDEGPDELLTELRRRLREEHGIASVGLAELVLDRTPIAANFAPHATFVWRLKNRPPHTNTPRLLRAYFVEQEWRNALLGLSVDFPGRCINDPICSLRASAKPLQLEVARRVGLTTPRTLITNDRTALRAFVADGGEVIMKPLDTTFTGNPAAPGDTLFMGPRPLRSVDLDDVSDEQVRTTPVIAQARIEKRHELRVVVYGDQACFVKIDSQRHAGSALDWRRRQGDTSMFSVIEPDRSLTSMLTRYLSALGLHTGVFDLAMTADGEVVFFECNTEGEWMAIDRAVHGAISRVVATALAAFHRNAIRK